MSHADIVIAIATVVCILFSTTVMVYHKVTDTPDIVRVEPGIEGVKLDSIESRLDDAIVRQDEMIRRLEVITAEVEEREARGKAIKVPRNVLEELENAN